MDTGRDNHSRPVDQLFLFNADNFAAFVMTTVGADGMRQPHFAAVAALNQISGFQCIVCTASIATTFRQFTFW
jgi:hypothetical protein